jgi:hypothetical protein
MTQRVLTLTLHVWYFLASLVEPIFLSINGTITCFFYQDRRLKEVQGVADVDVGSVFPSHRSFFIMTVALLLIATHIWCLFSALLGTQNGNIEAIISFRLLCLYVCMHVCVCVRARSSVKYAEDFYDEKLFIGYDICRLEPLPLNRCLNPWPTNVIYIRSS